MHNCNYLAIDPAQLWQHYVHLIETEQACKELQKDSEIRPLYHQTDDQIKAHCFLDMNLYRELKKQKLMEIAA